jgi:membrane-associated phospholipid phosphatase
LPNPRKIIFATSATRRLSLAATAAAGIAGVVAVRLAGTRWERANHWEAAVGAAGRFYPFDESPFGRALDAVLTAAVPLAALVVAVWLALRWRRGDRRVAVVGLGTMIGAVLTAEALKALLAARVGVPQWFDQGYPSGHTTTACTTALALLLASRRPRAALVGGAAFTAFVAGGVLLDGWHLPSDVAGALCLSWAWFFGLVALVDPPRPLRPTAVDAALAAAAAAAVVGALLLLHAGIPTDVTIPRVAREAVVALSAPALATILAAAALVRTARP